MNSLRPAFAALLVVAALGGAGCTKLKTHQGYIVDADLVNAIRPGVDNRASVLQTLGHPSFASQFGQGDYYYLARDSRSYGFTNPHPVDQLTLQISFDAAGTVTAIHRGSAEQIASVAPYGKTTPTLGRKRGFFQDLFGNIGSVGGGGGGGGAGPEGGGRQTP